MEYWTEIRRRTNPTTYLSRDPCCHCHEVCFWYIYLLMDYKSRTQTGTTCTRFVLYRKVLWYDRYNIEAVNQREDNSMTKRKKTKGKQPGAALFHTKYPKNVRASLRSARFFKCAPPLTWNSASAPDNSPQNTTQINKDQTTRNSLKIRS